LETILTKYGDPQRIEMESDGFVERTTTTTIDHNRNDDPDDGNNNSSVKTTQPQSIPTTSPRVFQEW